METKIRGFSRDEDKLRTKGWKVTVKNASRWILKLFKTEQKND